jgi:ABC-type phosphate transport system permease subunit
MGLGLSVASNKEKIANNMLNAAYADCDKITAITVTNVSNVQHKPIVGPGCERPTFKVSNTNAVDGNCLLGSLQKEASTVASKLSADAQAKLGIAISTNESEVENNIKNILSQKCADVSSESYISVTDTITQACDFEIIQSNSAKQACEINAAQQIITQIAQEKSAEAKGGSIFENIFGNIPVLIAIVIIVLIVGILLVWLLRSNKSSNTSTPVTTPASENPAPILDDSTSIPDSSDMLGGKRTSVNYTLILIIVIVLLIYLLSSVFCKRKQNVSKFN